MCTHNQCFRAKKKNILIFSSENKHFYSREISQYIAWRVYVLTQISMDFLCMYPSICCTTKVDQTVPASTPICVLIRCRCIFDVNVMAFSLWDSNGSFYVDFGS